MSRVYSVVQFFPEDPGHHCGYCKSSDGFIAQGMWAHLLNVEQYQALIDRGWRRSGSYCYKPVMEKMCCPPYTIRCDATQLRLTKSQKKVAKRVRNFLLKGRSKPQSQDISDHSDTMDGSVEHGHMELDVDAAMLERLSSRASGDLPQHLPAGRLSNGEENEPEESPKKCTEQLSGSHSNQSISARVDKERLSSNKQTAQKAAITSSSTNSSQQNVSSPTKTVRPGEGADPSRPTCRKKKEQRRARWRQKHGSDSGSAPDPGSDSAAATELEQLLETPADALHTLELRLVRSWPASDEYLASKPTSYLVYKQYQMAVHQDPEDKCTMTSYERFLGSSPLKGSDRYGSYHQQYWLDGELIAVGVLDVLPHCVSSKYFFYLPSYGFLSLGTYSSLRELELTRRLHRELPELRFYYMGYYIHTCPKMRYKGRLAPSYLLCPETYTWQPIEACSPLLDVSKYSRLAPASVSGPPAQPPTAALVLYNRRAMSYSCYRSSTDARDQAEVADYVRLVGPDVTANTLLYRE